MSGKFSPWLEGGVAGETAMFNQLFVFSRVAGSSVKIIELRNSNRDFRPVAAYRGPDPEAIAPIREMP